MAQTQLGAIKIAAKKSNMTVEEYESKSITEKKCCKCKKWQTKDNFNIDNSRHDKLTAKCHSCTRVLFKKTTKGRVSTFKNKTHTEEAKKIMSEQRKGCKSPMDGKNHTLASRKKCLKQKD